MLERYGIVTRETVLAEGIPGGFSSLYGELSNLEMLGTARRGYFVEGLGGAQFALAGAVERLRSLPRVDEELRRPRRDRPGPALRRQPEAGRGLRREARSGDGRGGRRPSRVAGAFVAAPQRRAGDLRRARRQGPAAAARFDEERLDRRRSRRSSRPCGRGGCRGSGSSGSMASRISATRLEQALVDAGFERQPRRLVASP